MTTKKTWKEKQNIGSFSSFISHHSSLQRKQRFTLIELLVVIAIIAILAGMLLPALNKARQMARRTACFNNLKNLALGHAQYHNDNNEYFVLSNPNDAALNINWGKLIAEYVGFNDNVESSVIRKSVFFCPNDMHQCKGSWARVGYAVNRYLLRPYSSSGYSNGWPVKMTSIRKPASHMLLMCVDWGSSLQPTNTLATWETNGHQDVRDDTNIPSRWHDMKKTPLVAIAGNVFMCPVPYLIDGYAWQKSTKVLPWNMFNWPDPVEPAGMSN